MLDFLKLLVPLLLTPENYDKMRQKLAAFAFYEIWAATWLMRTIEPVREIATGLERTIIPAPILETAPWMLHLNLSGLIIAGALALMTFIFHVHDRLSDRLSLRSRFDQHEILEPLARLVGAKLTQQKKRKLSASHDRVMRNVFYKYTSSTATDPLVDKHDIKQALDAWSWYWIFLEGTLIWCLTTLLALLLQSERISFITFTMFTFCLVMQAALYPSLKRRARAQIEAIADHLASKEEVKNYFNAV